MGESFTLFKRQKRGRPPTRHIPQPRKPTTRHAPTQVEDTMEQTPLVRISVTTGEFLASWPETVTAGDLAMMKGVFSALMDAWIDEVKLRKAAKSAGDVEYESWLAGEAK